MSRPLLRILGLSFGLAVTVGNTIGAGILRTPGDVASWLHAPWAFLGIWVLGAAYALLGANAVAELGTMLPRSGAQYVFARHAFGDYAGFVVGWSDWISTSASAAAIAIVIGESVAALTPAIGGHASAVAMATVAIFTLLLARGTRIGDRAQRITSAVKALALLALVAACFVFGRGDEGASAAAAAAAVPDGGTAAGTLGMLAALVLSAQSVIYSYDGWNGAIYFSEELEDPARQIPRSMFGGLLCVALIYLLVNAAFLYAAPLAAIGGSTLAAATVARRLFGGAGDTVVRVIVVLALPSAVNACLLMASRVLFGMGRDGLATGAAARVGAAGAPTVALAASGIVASALLATGTFGTVIAIAAFFFVVNYTVSFAAVFALRRREPAAPRPWRARGHPWTTGVVLAGSVAFLGGAVAGDPRGSGWALGLLLLSYPVFLAGRRLRGRATAGELSG